MTKHVWMLPCRFVDRLGRFRCLPRLEVCIEADAVWVACENPDIELQTSLSELPAHHSTVTEDGQLIPFGTRVPRGYVPDGPWQSLTDWMQGRLPAPAFSGVVPAPVKLEMVRQTNVAVPGLLVTDFELWFRYATAAPQVRLDRLSFAADSERTVIIRGMPLPPLRGDRYCLEGNIAVEAGWSWSPPVGANVLAQALDIADQQLALLRSDGSWISVAEENFVHASRAAVRATKKVLPDAF